MGPDLVSSIEITGIYGREHAGQVVEAALRDYEDSFGELRRAWENLEDRIYGVEGEG
jgi:hypothetical protein